MKTILFSLLSAVMAFTTSAEEDQLLGRWKATAVVDGVTQYERVVTGTDEGWISFLPEGALEVRQNAGWCGTPPISYRVYQGTFKRSEENHLTLMHGFWGGQDTTVFKIVSLDQNKLALRFLQRGTLE